MKSYKVSFVHKIKPSSADYSFGCQVTERNPFDVLRSALAMPGMATRLAGIVVAAKSYESAVKLAHEMDVIFCRSGRQGYAELLEHDVFCSSLEWTHSYPRLRRFAAEYIARHAATIE